MNIHATNPQPKLCAQYLADQHVRSQLGETGRLLVTALHRRGMAGSPLMGKPYNPNNRFALWASASWDNFGWLVRYGSELVQEYEYRFGKVHKGSPEIIACMHVYYHVVEMDNIPLRLPRWWPRCERTRAMSELDTHDAYKALLFEKYNAWLEQGRTPTWTKRPGMQLLGSST